MSLGTNRDYKTRGRRTDAVIRVHIDRTGELMAEGMPRDAASLQAHDELVRGDLAERVKATIKALKETRS